MSGDASWHEIRFRSPDGLELFARDYGPQQGSLLPVLCLSGLTRNSKDAHPLACRLAESRRVIAPDYRGRGRSEYAAHWSSYRVDVEVADAVRLLDRLKLDKVVVIGTSRGGLIAMAMAAQHRNRLAGVVLNDVGPELEPAGLIRIGSYLGRKPRFTTWRGAVAALKRTNPGFDSLSQPEWLAFARRVFRDEAGRPVLDYDRALRRTFPTPKLIAAGAVKPAWDLFACLDGLPVTALRGEHSDLLSPTTLARMAARSPGLEAVTIKDRGHAPFLDEADSVAAIERLLGRCQDTAPEAGRAGGRGRRTGA